MIDDEKEVTQLLRDMEGQLPISVRPARELVELLTRRGTKCRPVTATRIVCRTGSRLSLIGLGLLIAATRARSAPNDWAEGTPGKDNGASF